eukprot:4865502-Lingulodinium_polyedra.AAC.1
MVKVFAIANVIEPVGKTGVETCHSPRLANAHVGVRRVAGTESVHTPITSPRSGNRGVLGRDAH